MVCKSIRLGISLRPNRSIKKILALEPLHADALHLIGVIAHQTGHHNTAIEQIRRAIALNPSGAEFHNNLGEAYRALNKLEEAEAHYRQAVSLKPDYVEPFCYLGAVRIAQGRLEDTASCYRQAVALRPGYREAHIDLGVVLQTQGQFDEAISCYRRALNIKPNDLQARMKLGAALWAAIDYFISSELLEPKGAERHYSERVVRLKHLPTYYYKPDAPALKSRKDFGLEEDRVIYLCPQSLFKFHPDFDALLAGILRAHPQGQVVIMEGQWKCFTELILERFRKTIPDVLDRVHVLPRQNGQDFIRLMSLADVILDPLKWSGGNTTYEALSFGIPIVTMPSEFMRGRVTYACYKQMGVLDCVVSNGDAYVQLAVRLGTDPGYRAKIKEKLLAANGVLYENAAVVRELEQFFIEAAQKKG